MKHYISSSDLKNGIIPKWEFHVHTNFTDGLNSIKEIVASAITQNIEILAFTEHTEPWQAKKKDWFKHYVEEINAVKNQYKGIIEIILGIEAPLLSFDGTLDCTQEMLDQADFILGAAHRYPGIEGKKVSDLTPSQALDLEYKTLEKLCDLPEVHAIAHIGATCMKYCGPFPLDLTRSIVKKAVDSDKIVEINHAYHEPLDDYLSIMIDENAKIIPGSNAHKKEDLGKVYRALQNWNDDRIK